jgi:DNA-binding transcriptional regulator WhiA
MQQNTRMMTIPEVAPTKTRIFVVAFWKENSNRAIENTKTLNKSSSLSVERIDRDLTTHDHISRAYVRLNMMAKGSRWKKRVFLLYR